MTEDISRRTFLKGVGAVGVLSISPVPSGVASASHTSTWLDHKPDHVKVYYDDRLDELKKYRPYVRTGHLDVQPESCNAAWFESPEWDVDVACYWYYYPTQQGLSSVDSHYGDREPVFVFVAEDGSIDRINYSGWHYLVARHPDPPTVDSTHPHLTVAKPHHHYYVEPSGPSTGEYVSLSDFRGVVDTWYANGWRAAADIVANPWASRRNESYWQDDAFWGVGLLEQRAKMSLYIARLRPDVSVQTDVE